MPKDTFYFSHDYNARNDEKIKRLIRKHGMIGYGIFWSIVEDLYNNANALQTDYDGIAYDLRTDSDIVASVVNDFDLFVFDGDFFGSNSVQERLDQRNIKSESARKSASYRWNNANAMQTLSDSNAKKERKGKEIKGKENKKKKSAVFLDLELGRAYFTSDGTVFQDLGVEQKKLLAENKLHYYEIIEGEIF